MFAVPKGDDQNFRCHYSQHISYFPQHLISHYVSDSNPYFYTSRSRALYAWQLCRNAFSSNYTEYHVYSNMEWKPTYEVSVKASFATEAFSLRSQALPLSRIMHWVKQTKSYCCVGVCNLGAGEHDGVHWYRRVLFNKFINCGSSCRHPHACGRWQI
jgi:hypothetical protein